MRRFSVSSQPDRIVCSTPDGDVIIPDPSPIYQLLLEECFFYLVLSHESLYKPTLFFTYLSIVLTMPFLFVK